MRLYYTGSDKVNQVVAAVRGLNLVFTLEWPPATPGWRGGQVSG